MLNSIQRETKDAATAYFRGFTASSTELGERDVVGWGIGAKVIDGVLRPEENVLRVYIREFPEPTIKAEFGLPIEFIAVGQITAYQNCDRHRPVVCGVSVGHSNVDAAGTLGCLVEKEGNHYSLSNNHVLANSNEATPGDVVIQPGSIDGGTSSEDNIATLEPYSEIDFSGDANDIDAAIVQVGDTNQTLVSLEIIDIGTPSTTSCPASLGQTVRKSGRTTGHTVGLVEDISADFWVSYGNEAALFEDQIVVIGIDADPFSAPGDSGSLIVDKQMLEPGGLLFAGNDSGLTIANHINLVLGYYGVSVVGEQGVNA